MKEGHLRGNRVICFASGGHAAVVLDALQAMMRRSREAFQSSHDDAAGDDKPTIFCGFVDSLKSTGEEVCGFPVIGGDDDCGLIRERVKPTHYLIGLGSVKGGQGKRRRLFETAQSFGLKSLEVIHPSAVVSPSAELGAASVVMAGAVVQPRARIGVNVIVNTHASVDHDCSIGNHSHIAPGATLSGNVTVGEDTLIGVGATVVQGVKIGSRATIGAGAVVVSDVPDDATWLGVPARPV